MCKECWCMIFQVAYLTSWYMCWECSSDCILCFFTQPCPGNANFWLWLHQTVWCIINTAENFNNCRWVWSNLLLIIPHPHTQSVVLSRYICMYTHVATVWMLWGSILFLILNLHRFSDSLTCQTKLYFWVDKLRISLSYILKHFGKCVPFWA